MVFSMSPGFYNNLRYIHSNPYAGPPVHLGTYRENSYHSARTSGVIGDQRPQNVEYLRTDQPQVRPRLSLLPPATPEYLNSLSRNRVHQSDGYRDPSMGPSSGMSGAMDSNSPVKKIRLGDSKPSDIQPLRIETREEGSSTAYNPQVEAISPTLPSDNLQEDALFRSTKDELLLGIARVDREIAKTELQIAKHKKKQQELEEAAKKPSISLKEEDEVPQPVHQSPAQKIYAENRKKAQEAHSLLGCLGPKIDLPLYNQPSDTPVFNENKKKHAAFKGKLLEHLRRKQSDREVREKYLSSTYSRLVQEWLRKVDKAENSQKRKAKEAKNREFFEKVFPKLRKQREDRERFNRVGARIKSDADMEEVIDGLQEQEMEDKKMRSYAVVPPLLLDSKQRTLCYVNNNGKVDDFGSDYKERMLLNVWTQSEKDIFKEKFLQHVKNFGVIASYLEKKSVSDCVQYYYLSKKTENYKRLLRKSRQRARSGRNPHGKVNAGGVGGAPGSSLDILTSGPGVTTRLQREQLQKQEAPLTAAPSEVPEPSLVEPTASPSPYLIDSAPQPEPPPQLITSCASDVKFETKKKERRKEDKKKKEGDLPASSDEEDPSCTGGETGVPQICAVCKTESTCSRALSKSQAAQYGLKEDQIAPDARVCNVCRCKAVRSRYINCPVPTCLNAKGHRVKRLRPLPLKWIELTPSIKDPIAAEFKIDSSITKCCSACFNRLMKRIGPSTESTGEEGQNLNNQTSQLLRWTDEEIESFKKGMRSYGTKWAEVCQIVGPTKTQHQCKNFYFNYRKKLGLDQILQEYKKAHLGEERKPALTDEEESGSSTSSCEDAGGEVANDSDTASANSPSHEPIEELTVIIKAEPPDVQVHFSIKKEVDDSEGEKNLDGHIDIKPIKRELDRLTPQQNKAPTPTQAQGPVKEDYDSSTTTADEEQGVEEMDPAASRPSPKREGEEDRSSPITVKDLVLGVIEMQFMKNQGNQNQKQSVSVGPPTISSILKSDHGVSYSAQRERPGPRNSEVNSLATLSVVNSHHTHLPRAEEVPKEGLVVVQVPQPNSQPRENVEPEPVTLDLSIKRPREVSGVHQATKQTLAIHQVPQQGHGMYRVAQVSEQQFYQQVNPPVVSKAGTKLAPGPVSVSPAPKAQHGSIVHGTPVSSANMYHQNRYEPSTSLVRTSHKETSSMAQETAMQRNPLYATSSSDYYGKRVSGGGPNSQAVASGASSTGFYQPRPPAYTVEQRQIIMNDYITSQQMHGSASAPTSRSSREKLHYQPPTSSRQGVIQRHNPKPPSPHYPAPPPGHEAFSSLVDVAVRQPSLPVPPPILSEHGKSHGMNQEDKRHLHEGLGERFNRESPHDRFVSRDQERYNREAHEAQLQQQASRERESLHQQMREHQANLHREQMREREHREMAALHQREMAHQQQLMREHHSQQKLRDAHLQQLHQRDRQLLSYQQQQQRAPLHHDPHPQTNPAPQEAARGARGQGEASTLTAASLIDAIITHTINQSSDGTGTAVPPGACPAPQAQPRPGDRLFQGFHREASESGKMSPMKQALGAERKSPHMPHPHGQPPASHISSDHLDVFTSNQMQGARSGSYHSYDHQTWKLRRALQQKEVEQSQNREKEERNIVRFYQEPPVSLSPLDYVKNRIAEVMRTSEEDGVSKGDGAGGGEGGSEDKELPPASGAGPFHPYTYPFSALSINPSAGAVPPQSHPPLPKTGGPESVPEPAPLLSAQYEPLSDED